MNRNPIEQAASWDSLVDVVRHQARVRPDHPALIFLPDGDTEVGRLSYAELDRRARVFAAQLQQQGLQGRAILLMLPSSIYYVVAFVGCLYAGAIPVPGYPPTNSMHAERMAHIVADCNARGAIVATSSALESIGERLKQHFPDGLECLFIPIDGSGDAEAAGAAWREPALDRGCTAYLQYTSGSTSNPRGVVVTHGNLLSYCQSYCEAADVNPDDVIVTWLPLFHDMGLILGVIQALFVGATIVMMPPLCFLQKPLRWLQAISRYRGTISYAPNFAYELCASALYQALVNTLDLSSWAVAGNGAEPVNAETLKRFAHRFTPVGFRPEAMNPTYGLAETTLSVTSHPRLTPVKTLAVDAEAMTRGEAQEPADGARTSTLVSCGRAWLDTEVLTVDPATRLAQADRHVGEIWVRGSLVTQGYWQRPQETNDIFAATLADGRGPYLRTGDLGVWVDGHLYITGRVKDVIIIRGQNHYPQDIEHTACRSHPALEVGHGAAFSVTVGAEERLVVVQEVRRSQRHKVHGAEAAQAIRQAIAETHGLQVHAVQLLRPASVHVTSSGKIQRQACRRSFLDGSFEVLHEWREALHQESPAATAEPSRGSPQQPSAPVRDWLVHRIASMQSLGLAQVDTTAAFSALGLDSLKLMTLAGDLASWLGTPIDPTVLYSHSTIDALARFVTAPALEASAAVRRPQPAAEPVAIVGLACRFPGAGSADEFWRLLDDGVDAITEIPSSRWNGDAFYQPGPPTPGKAYTKWGGFLDDIDRFDAQFFGISPREAAGMDPQQRMLLQTTWHALEDAGIPPDTLAGSDTGVFIGAMTHDYELLEVLQNARLDAYFGTGNHASILANRISYLFDLRGPSWVAETACSSSLIALHGARTSLQSGECSVALVGGVNVLLVPELFVALSQAQMLSPDGRCMTFDARANGYVRSEGCAVLVLKRHADAVRDGDRIYGVIRGTAINQDGKSNGITAPNGDAQQAVIRQALAAARVDACEISYVEAHGTGTSLGDPIEIDALKRTYGQPSAAQPTLWIGAVKTHIGHTEPVSGLAGLTKVVLALQHERLPANLHLQSVNPHIALEGTRCALLNGPQAWKRGPAPRLAAVSSFGFGGANAHVIVSDADAHRTPDASNEDQATTQQLLTLSAKTPQALTRSAEQLAAFLQTAAAAKAGLPAICHTRNVHRTHLPHRLAVRARSGGEIALALAAYAQQGHHDLVTASTPAAAPGSAAFLFTGQGSQYDGMGDELYRRHALFRSVLDQCDELLRPLLDGQSLVKGLYGGEDHRLDLSQTRYAQPALFAVEYALAQLWLAAGLRPKCLIGHSLGEYVAACVAGVFSLADALKLVAHRGRLMQHRTARGAMVAVRAEEGVIARLLADLAADAPPDLAVAAVNTAVDIVVSGDPDSASAWIERWQSRLPDGEMTVTPLRVERAFHSPLMATMLEEFTAIARQVTYHAPSIDVISNISGGVVRNELADAAYWIEHIMRPVAFDRGMQALRHGGCDVFVEVGPHPVLSAFGQQSIADGLWLPSLRRGADAMDQLLASIGEWYAHGAAVDWLGWARSCSGPAAPLPQRVALPAYPFERERHWFTAGAPAISSNEGHPLVGQRLRTSEPLDCRFQAQIAGEQPWFIGEHRAFDVPVLPMAAFIEAALAAVRRASPDPMPEWTLRALSLRNGLPMPEGRLAELECVVRTTDGRQFEVAVNERHRPGHSSANAPWSDWQNCIQVTAAATCMPAAPAPDLALLQGRLSPQPLQDLYARAAAIGLGYGPAFQGIKALWIGGRESLARVEMPRHVADDRTYHLHPATLDACFHGAIPFLEQALAGRPLAILPTGFTQCTVRQRLPGRVWVHGVWHGEQDPGRYCADIAIFGEDGTCVVSITGMQLALGGRASVTAERNTKQIRFYRQHWVALDDLPASAPRAVAGPSSDVRPWLIACRDPQTAQHLQDECRALGVTAHIAHAGSEPLQGGHGMRLRWDSKADWQAWFEALRSQRCRPAGLIYHGGSTDEQTDLADRVSGRAQAVLHACQQFLQAFAEADPAVVVCTTGAQVPPEAAALGQRISGMGLAQCAETAVVKAIAPEFQRVKALQVDLDPAAGHQVPLGHILGHLAALEGSGHIALRDGRFHDARLREVTLDHGPARAPAVRQDATYLVTGGLRGIGLETAQWLARQGALHLALVGRSIDAAGEAAVDALRAAGATVQVFLADVSRREDLANALASMHRTMPPLRGVFHSAGLTDDRSLATMAWDSMQKVMAPKVRGGWLLHELTLDLELDHFVLYSSLASLAANTGQLNYIAACSFLDALALHRRQRGLAGLSINWGYWSETGLAARSGLDDRMAYIGVGGMATAEGLDALGRLMSAQPAQCGAAIVDWTRVKSTTFPITPYRLLADLGDQAVADGAAAGAPEVADIKLRAVLAPLAAREAKAEILSYLLNLTARILKLGAGGKAGIEPGFATTALNQLGFDSLMAVEMRNRIRADSGADIALKHFLAGSTAAEVADLILTHTIAEQVTAVANDDLAPQDLDTITI